jgi:hypothetical protein
MLLWGTLTADGWLELLPLRLVTLAQVGLPYDSSDREMWRFAQGKGMILLTANRRMDGEDSLEQIIREENTTTSLHFNVWCPLEPQPLLLLGRYTLKPVVSLPNQV